MSSLGFIFPGYGSQCVGMGKDFYDRYRIVQERFEEASNCVGLNFVKLCFASSEKELAKPLHAYLSLFVVHAALYDVLCEHGVRPEVITGWGVGYASVLNASRAINFPDGLYLLRKYLMFFEESVNDGRATNARIIGMPLERLYDFLDRAEICDHVSLGFVRSEKEFIVVGEERAVQKLINMVDAEVPTVYITQEPAAYGLHAFLQRPFFLRLSAYLAKIDCHPLQFNIITQEGVLVRVGQQLEKSSLIRFVQEPINIPRIMRSLHVYDHFLQIGPNHASLAIIRKFIEDKPIVQFVQRCDLRELLHG